MRDAWINTIGEGANEVLKAFIALVGIRETAKGRREPSMVEKAKLVPADALGLYTRPLRADGANAGPYPRQSRCSGRWPIPWPAASPDSGEPSSDS